MTPYQTTFNLAPNIYTHPTTSVYGTVSGTNLNVGPQTNFLPLQQMQNGLSPSFHPTNTYTQDTNLVPTLLKTEAVGSTDTTTTTNSNSAAVPQANPIQQFQHQQAQAQQAQQYHMAMLRQQQSQQGYNMMGHDPMAAAGLKALMTPSNGMITYPPPVPMPGPPGTMQYTMYPPPGGMYMPTYMMNGPPLPPMQMAPNGPSHTTQSPEATAPTPAAQSASPPTNNASGPSVNGSAKRKASMISNVSGGSDVPASGGPTTQTRGSSRPKTERGGDVHTRSPNGGGGDRERDDSESPPDTPSGPLTAGAHAQMRRYKHKEVEVRRRKKISNLFQDLATLLECGPTDKASILAIAARFVKYAKEKGVKPGGMDGGDESLPPPAVIPTMPNHVPVDGMGQYRWMPVSAGPAGYPAGYPMQMAPHMLMSQMAMQPPMMMPMGVPPPSVHGATSPEIEANGSTSSATSALAAAAALAQAESAAP